ncbi:hypothetical protein KPL39_03900 [Clostridium gasigenes]|uniref:hypothetical protein n=1 Tax=Clostridium gasigenes TaxID=94869 RepID=UPI001C0E6D6E|nr:hypothetical protein [Clostridium gasigenes]MBU3135407.1 hypothetical protein [Clostridium gasigenes]
MGKNKRIPNDILNAKKVVIEENIQEEATLSNLTGLNCIGLNSSSNNCIGCTGCNSPENSTLNQTITKIAALTVALEAAQQNIGSLTTGGEDEKFFYDRKVSPLIDMLYFLTQSAQGASITAQNMQSNAYSKKKQIRLPIDLSYEIIKEAYCVFETFKRRNAIYRHMVENDIKHSGCINEKCYKSSFSDLEEEYFEELHNSYNKIYNDDT